MGEGGTNDMVGDPVDETVTGPATSGPATSGATASGIDGDGPQELSRAAAVAVTVLAALCGSAVVLAVFHWLGWAVPGIGWIVAKAGIRIAVGGFAGLAVGLAWLRGRLRARPRG
ncbi:hypothetical protein [Streptomyces sp. NRRL S-350]|uniref:hypothetical protein n=1 Tax=Streptomyces sp. NRRL S-350 TaxID=1463902 RepID=UPI00131CCC49|nr:hypothetical protein [Streptomyces sp. NRRL S-350]